MQSHDDPGAGARRIRAYPRWPHAILVCGGAVVSALPISGIVMTLFERAGRKLERHELQLLLLVMTLAFITLLSTITLRYQIWELSEGVLSRGIFRGMCIHLSDVEFIRLGMPPTEGNWLREPTPTMIEQRENAIVLGLRDHSLLPLNLLDLEHGHAIHDALLTAIGNANRVPFRPQQKLALSGRCINRLRHVKQDS